MIILLKSIVDPLKNGVLSETLGLKRPPNFFPTLEVPIRYWVLNGEDLTNVDGLIVNYHFFSIMT